MRRRRRGEEEEERRRGGGEEEERRGRRRGGGGGGEEEELWAHRSGTCLTHPKICSDQSGKWSEGFECFGTKGPRGLEVDC